MATGDYATLEQVKNACRIPSTNTNFDDWLLDTITQVSREIDLFCHRSFYARTASRLYDYQRSRRLYLKDDLHSVTQILHGADREEVLPPSSYFLYPEIGPPYHWIEINESSTIQFRWDTLTPQQSIEVQGVWGFLDAEGKTPSPITRALCNWIMYLHTEAGNPGIQSKTIGDFTVSYNQILATLKDGPPNGVAKTLAYYTNRNNFGTPIKQNG